MDMFTGTFGTPEAVLILGLVAVALPLVYLADRLRIEVGRAVRRARLARRRRRAIADAVARVRVTATPAEALPALPPAPVEVIRAVPYIDPNPTTVIVPASAPVVVDPVHVGASEEWSPLAEVAATEAASSPMDDTDLLVAFDLRLREIEREHGVAEALTAFQADSMRLPAYRALRLESTGEMSRAELRTVLGKAPIPVRRPLALTAA